jgi:hypothetical protein
MKIYQVHLKDVTWRKDKLKKSTFLPILWPLLPSFPRCHLQPVSQIIKQEEMGTMVILGKNKTPAR